MKVASESSSLYCGQSGMHLSPTNKRTNGRGMPFGASFGYRSGMVRALFRVVLKGLGQEHQVSVFGDKPSLDDDTESTDSGLSGVSDCKPVCFVGCNLVGVAGADESQKPYAAFNSSMVTNTNYGWTKLHYEIWLQW